MSLRLFAVIALFLAACGGSADVDAGTVDAGHDAGTAPVDAGTPPDTGVDAPSAPTDAGVDAPSAPMDAGVDAAGSTGSACAMASDCASDDGGVSCLTSMPSGMFPTFPGGYCSSNCSSSGFGSACGNGGTCEPFPGMGPRCWRTCTSDSECRVAEGYRCQLHPTFMDASVCFPAADGG